MSWYLCVHVCVCKSVQECFFCVNAFIFAQMCFNICSAVHDAASASLASRHPANQRFLEPLMKTISTPRHTLCKPWPY